MSVLDKFMPRSSGVRDPRDPKKKNGMFINWPRYLFIGGKPGIGFTLKQHGEAKPQFPVVGSGQDGRGPINDRGRGR